MPKPAGKVVHVDFPCVTSKKQAEHLARYRFQQGMKDRMVYGQAEPVNLVYREGMRNVCQCCGSTAWHVGRTTAECATCWSPLPLTRAMRIDQ